MKENTQGSRNIDQPPIVKKSWFYVGQLVGWPPYVCLLLLLFYLHVILVLFDRFRKLKGENTYQKTILSEYSSQLVFGAESVVWQSSVGRKPHLPSTRRGSNPNPNPNHQLRVT